MTALVSSGTLVLASQGAIETGSNLIVGEAAARFLGLVVPSVMQAGNEQAVPEPGTLALCGAALLRCRCLSTPSLSPTQELKSHFKLPAAEISAAIDV